MSTSNILSIYKLAKTSEVIQGSQWYPTAKLIAERIASEYNMAVSTVVGVIAALSPRNKWERNLVDAENLIRVWCVDRESADSVKVCTFGKNKAKAIQILNEQASYDDVLTILSGPKLREFYTCIMGYVEDVCIDGHAYSVWAGDRITLDSIPSIGIKLRREIKKAYVDAASQVGIKPSEMQAITWCAWRRIHGVA